MRTALLTLAGAAALSLAACGSDASSEGLCPAPTDAASVEMADFSYAPVCAAVEAGAPLELSNAGQVPHTFTVEGTEVDETVDAGETSTVDIAGVAAGTYRVICTLHPQMEGALRIR